jgi:membrane protein
MRSLPSLPPRLDPLVAAIKRIMAADPFLMSAAIAYNAIFALVPLAFSAVAAISMVGGDPDGLQSVEQTLSAKFPAEVSGFFDPILEGAQGEVGDMGPLFLTVSLLVALWSGSRAIYAMQKALRMIEGVEETRRYLVTRGLGMLFTIGGGIALAVSYFAVIVGDWLTTKLADLGINLGSAAWISVGAILAWVVVVLYGIYRWGTPTEGRMPLLSAAVAAVVLALTTWLAAILIPEFGGSTLAAFGSVGVILVWSYAVAIITISVPALVPSIVDVARGRTP